LGCLEPALSRTAQPVSWSPFTSCPAVWTTSEDSARLHRARYGAVALLRGVRDGDEVAAVPAVPDRRWIPAANGRRPWLVL